MIHHRNYLHHYRYSIHKVFQNVNVVCLDADFAENLSISVKYEPQSLHWSHELVTLHSGIVKNLITHMCLMIQSTANTLLKAALKECWKHQKYKLLQVIIESDNCSPVSPHFHGMQEIANRYNIPVIRIYGMAEHGKGKIDHVGGTTKNTIHQEVAKGESFFFS